MLKLLNRFELILKENVAFEDVKSSNVYLITLLVFVIMIGVFITGIVDTYYNFPSLYLYSFIYTTVRITPQFVIYLLLLN